jgi:hypothetical protein
VECLTDLLSCLEVEHQFELGWLFKRDITRVGALEEFVHRPLCVSRWQGGPLASSLMSVSPNHSIRFRQHFVGDGEADLLGSFKIDNEFEGLRLCMATRMALLL